MTAPDDLHRAWGDELTAVQMYMLLALRTEVFVVEQRCPYRELDGRDLEGRTRHLWIGRDTDVRGYLRLLAEPGGGVRIGRVCIRARDRGRGLARVLMMSALDEIGGRDSVLDAQSRVADLYRAFGFRVVGAEFMEDGIPHVPMRRDG